MSGGRNYLLISAEISNQGIPLSMIFRTEPVTGWLLAAVVPNEEIQATATSLQGVFRVATLLGLLMVGTVVLLVIRPVSAALHDLAQKSDQRLNRIVKIADGAVNEVATIAREILEESKRGAKMVESVQTISNRARNTAAKMP